MFAQKSKSIIGIETQLRLIYHLAKAIVLLTSSGNSSNKEKRLDYWLLTPISKSD
jgi:hypothetical protein